MMYKINEQFKVIGKGTNLKAADNDFILHHSLSLATLKEVVKANEIKFANGTKNKETLLTVIEKSFNEREDIPTMNEETKTPQIDQKYIDIVKNGFAESKNVDIIQVELVTAGLKFKAAASTFKKIAESLGLMLSAKDRFEKIANILGDYVPTDYESVEKTVAAIVKEVKDTTEAQALATLRKICKDKEVEFPKKPAGSKSGKGPRGFKATMFDWIVANKECTKKELEDFIVANEQRLVYIPLYWDMILLCRKYTAPAETK